MDPVDRRQTLDALTAAARAGNVGPDAFILSPDSPYRAEHLLINAYLDAARRVGDYRSLRARAVDSSQPLLSGDAEARRRALLAAFERFTFGACSYGPVDGPMAYALCALTSDLLAQRVPLGHDDILCLLDTVTLTSEPSAPGGFPRGVAPCLPILDILGYVDEHIEREGLSPQLYGSLRCVHTALESRSSAATCREARRLARRLLRTGVPGLGVRRHGRWPAPRQILVVRPG